MIKYTPLVCSLLILPGCEFNTLKPSVDIDNLSNTKSCRITPADLDRLQHTETKFLSKPGQRSSIMQNAIREKDRLLLTLLLSTPLSSKEQLQQSKRYYTKLVLYPHSACPGDRYFDLRDQQTSALLWMRAEHDNLLAENRALQVTIDALTQIETDLSNDREIQE
jgi:hypothetical protein